MTPATINETTPSQPAFSSIATYEFIDSKELARRWCLPVSWIREQVRKRVVDPLPHVRFIKYVRFRWGSPELEGWAERRIIGSNNKKVSRAERKETIQ